MMFRNRLGYLIFLICKLVLRATCDGVLSIKLFHFENTNSYKSDGTCCDGYDSSGKCNSCEYVFEFCLTDPSKPPCSISEVKTDYVTNDDYYLFESFFYIRPFGDRMNNPMQFPFKEWNGKLGFQVQVLDQDNAGRFDDISKMEKNMTINATRSGTEVQKMVLLEGKKHHTGVVPKLTAIISVTCKANYLMPTCREYCVNTDNATGHYICNYVTGTRECLSGWHGDKCDKKVSFCTPMNGTLGHYTCDLISGKKVCLPGWRNVSKNCTEEIVIKPTFTVSSMKSSSKLPSMSLSVQPSTSNIIASSNSVATRMKLEGDKTMTFFTRAILASRSTMNDKTTDFHTAMFTKNQTLAAKYQSTKSYKQVLSTNSYSIRGSSTHVLPSITEHRTASNAFFFNTLTRVKTSHVMRNTPVPSSSATSISFDANMTSVAFTTTSTPSNPEAKKRFDLTKIIAFLIAVALLVSMVVTVSIMLNRKHSKNRVQSISLSERYKQNSARVTISTRQSKCSNLSTPSIGGLMETRIDGSINQSEERSAHSGTSGIRRYSGRSLQEKQAEGNIFQERQPGNSRFQEREPRSSIFQERQPGRNIFQEGQHGRATESKIERFASTTKNAAIMMPKEAFLVVPRNPYSHF